MRQSAERPVLIPAQQAADLIRWARNDEQWAQAACDRLGLTWRRQPAWVARNVRKDQPLVAVKELAR